MTRDDQEMALWTAEYVAARGVSAASASGAADEAVAEFRKRYPPQLAEPAPVWYDEPPFDKSSDDMFPVWIEDYPYPILVAYFRDGWAYQVPGCGSRWNPLNRRRVSPIAKPPEPKA